MGVFFTVLDYHRINAPAPDGQSKLTGGKQQLSIPSWDTYRSNRRIQGIQKHIIVRR